LRLLKSKLFVNEGVQETLYQNPSRSCEQKNRRGTKVCGFADANPQTAAGRAQRIAAESPQDLHRQIRGLEAESLVFGAKRQKCAIFDQKNIKKTSQQTSNTPKPLKKTKNKDILKTKKAVYSKLNNRFTIKR
jgi:hypothetical protein